MIDPIKEHFAIAMGGLRFVIDAVIESGNRELAEIVSRELNGQNVKLANHFGFQVRTGKVHKVSNTLKTD